MSGARVVRNLKAENGGQYISDALAHTPVSPYVYFEYFEAYTACVIAAVANVAGNPGGNALAAASIPAGQRVYGLFTSITLTSGTGYAANKV